MKRILSIDFTRGFVIVIMALDHIRDLLHTTSQSEDALDFNTTTGPLFLTRWITHLCAPTFVFLAGTSAYFTKKKQNNLSVTRRFLLTRGLWFILLELTVIGLGIWGDIFFHSIMFQVIYAIGFSFIILSLLLKLSPMVLGGIGLGIITLHNLLPPIQFTNPAAQLIAGLLFSPTVLPIGPDRIFFVAYPAVPWLGILLFGYSFGQAFEKPILQRRKTLVLAGSIALLLFVLLRSFNLYGNPVPWSPKGTVIASILSFINVTKYPPSLLYASLMLGIMFFILRLSDDVSNKFTRFFTVYGTVPFFFYILHWYLIHISMFVMIRLQGVQWKDIPLGPFSFGRPATGVGIELPYIYLYWVCLILFFYPLCKWYGKYKADHREKKWLSYL